MFRKPFVGFTWVFVGLTIVTFFLPWLFTQFKVFNYDFTKTGEIGDTIGGTMDPFVGIVAGVLTFAAFYVQYKANDQQKGDLEIERFENKFYNLIEIHRNNVNEMIVGKTTSGRRVFVTMYSELKATYWVVFNYYRDEHLHQLPGDVIPEEVIYNVAYLIFFFGVGQSSSEMVSDIVGERYLPFFGNVEAKIQDFQVSWRIAAKEKQPLAVNTDGLPFVLRINYLPYNGHVSRLSHYIRNLFQLVKFVDQQKDKLFDKNQKYQYASTIRSQLTIHEQLLIYYNALSVLGKPWRDDKLIEKYCMIKSIPLPLADFYKTPVEQYGETYDGRPLYEWNDIKNRIQELV